MASFSLSQNAAGTVLYWTVSGIQAGDLVVFHIRYEPNDNNAHYRRFPADGTYTASGTTYDFNCPIEPGQHYACTVNINLAGTNLPLQYITANGSPGRPSNWTWPTTIYSGAPYENLTAAIWSSFESRINEFRRYKGGSNYGFTAPVSGVTLLNTCFSEAEAAISGISGHGTVPAVRELSMAYLSGLADALNVVT